AYISGRPSPRHRNRRRERHMTATSHGAQTYPFGPANRLELHPEYARLRREQPMARVVMPFGGEAWLVTRYGDARVVLSDPRFSRAATIGRDIPRTTPFVRPDGAILSMDPPEHSRLRKLVAKAFTARRIEQLRP